MFCPPDERIPNMKGTFIHVPQPPTPTTSSSKYDDTTTSFLTSSDLSVVAPNNNNNNNSNHNPKTYSSQHSSMISYNKRVKAHYALKSLILDRCSTPELKEELKNEGRVFYKHSFLYKSQIFLYSTYCMTLFSQTASNFGFLHCSGNPKIVRSSQYRTSI
jgi:hypothetical protein